MNILIDGLPFCYRDTELNTDYRVWMKFELLLQDKKIKEEEKLTKIIQLTVKSEYIDINDIKGLVDYLIWFYSCGKEEENDEEEESDFKEKKKLIYSFEHDADYIYAAFMECYKIDLVETDMHWWKFKSLLKSLNENCLYSKILGYRSMKISSKMSKDEQKFYQEMKKTYALPDSRTEEEKESDFANSLFAGM